jgi:predicted nucleic acid-binding protein
MYCIDASVLINSEIESEKLHEYSEKLMEKIREKGITILVPEIVLPEISSAIARGSNNSEKALEFRSTSFSHIMSSGKISSI